ncbi:YhcH/YjgK/YiaL family protein [Parabacteroides sp. PF5-6]|uniref:YhcH/YjgK/YiaL family protein n=1 Tax=Parabacteroides sp. PF5-6 TaxID=1742403 RepID=UPI0024073639|nr:YhcH/YjgK/YiaL family protein [Parabacteroides sp. PF5-6]MDF9829646.1 YhcH/YjgK/YiaL family protein [Parabacteroides sp. PF5-6]
MIHDSRKNMQAIASLHPLFAQAIAFVEKTDFTTLEDGRYEIEGDRLYVAISTITGKKQEEAVLETHNRYIDIQFPLSGVETIGWKAGSDLQTVTQPYAADKDITFFGDQPTTYTAIHPGEFAVYFPEDGHAPGIGQGTIRKVVIKVITN